MLIVDNKLVKHKRVYSNEMPMIFLGPMLVEIPGNGHQRKGGRLVAHHRQEASCYCSDSITWFWYPNCCFYALEVYNV